MVDCEKLADYILGQFQSPGTARLVIDKGRSRLFNGNKIFAAVTLWPGGKEGDAFIPLQSPLVSYIKVLGLQITLDLESLVTNAGRRLVDEVVRTEFNKYHNRYDRRALVHLPPAAELRAAFRAAQKLVSVRDFLALRIPIFVTTPDHKYQSPSECPIPLSLLYPAPEQLENIWQAAQPGAVPRRMFL